MDEMDNVMPWEDLSRADQNRFIDKAVLALVRDCMDTLEKWTVATRDTILPVLNAQRRTYASDDPWYFTFQYDQSQDDLRQSLQDLYHRRFLTNEWAKAANSAELDERLGALSTMIRNFYFPDIVPTLFSIFIAQCKFRELHDKTFRSYEHMDGRRSLMTIRDWGIWGRAAEREIQAAIIATMKRPPHRMLKPSAFTLHDGKEVLIFDIALRTGIWMMEQWYDIPSTGFKRVQALTLLDETIRKLLDLSDHTV